MEIKTVLDQVEETVLPTTNGDDSVAISSLKTNSCESDDDPSNYFTQHCGLNLQSREGTIHMPQDDRTKNMMQLQDRHFRPQIITPQQVEISLDPFLESPLPPFLLEDDNCGEEIPLEKDVELLFPLADIGCETTPTLEYKEDFTETYRDNDISRVDETISNDDLAMRHFSQNSQVYQQLRSFLPLPKSFGPILCLLLHMDLSSEIHAKFVKQACGVVIEHLKEDGAHVGCSNKLNNKEKLQSIAGNIVDKLIETMGEIFDFPFLFQASAKTYSRLAAKEGVVFSIFFEENFVETKQEAVEPQAKTCNDATSMSDLTLSGVGRQRKQKRKTRMGDDIADGKIVNNKRTEFVPTLLQLAVAWGASYSTSDECQVSMVEFVRETSSHLQCLDPIERRNKWNDLMKCWHDRERKVEK